MAERKERRTRAPEGPPPPPNGGEEEARWYIVHTYSGMEEKVKKTLEQRITALDLKDRILEIVIPTEEVIEIREGKRTPKQERLFPGYLLIRMKMDDHTWYVVRNTPGVTGFISAADREGRIRPVPLSQEEVEQIFQRMRAEQPRPKVGLTKGQYVKIVDGPFKDFLGVVDEIDATRGKVRVLVSFFGRETPVELDFLQVERLT